MRGKDRLVVCALLVLGLALAWLGGWVREAIRARSGTAPTLPAQDLRVLLASRDLGSRLAELKSFPIYGDWFRQDPSFLRRSMGWERSLPSPWTVIPRGFPAAIGLYGTGWIAVLPRDAPAAELGRLSEQSELSGAWRRYAVPLELALRPVDAPPKPSLTDAALHVRIDLLAVTEHPARRRAGLDVVRSILPPFAEGRLFLSDAGRLEERWSFPRGRPSLLDALDSRPTRGVPTRGWDAVPPDARAAAWFRMALSEEDRNLGRILELPLVGEAAASLPGTVLVTLLEDGLEVRPLLVLDVDQPDRLGRVMDRLAALGVLTGATQTTDYRGARLLTWGAQEGGERRVCLAVVDGLLLGASRPGDVEDAIDRLRGEQGGRATSSVREALESLPPGSWKAVSRSAALTRQWARLLGSRASPGPSPPQEVHAVLRREGGSWLLEGSGGAPTFASEPLLPSLLAFARDLDRPVE